MNKEDAIMTVLLTNLEAHRLPDIFYIQEELENGELLSDWAVEFLEESVREIQNTMPFVNHHPELQELYARSARLFLDISSKALQAERAQGNFDGFSSAYASILGLEVVLEIKGLE